MGQQRAKVAGKTVTRQLSAEQVERYKPWFEDARKLRALIEPRDRAVSIDAPRAEDIEGLARELIHDAQQLQDPPIGGLVKWKSSAHTWFRALSSQPRLADTVDSPRRR